MKIIMLKGESNSGKTTTLHLVYYELITNKKVKVVKYKIIKTAPNDIEDFTCILKYKGLKVAIYSMGDDDKGIEKAIEDYTNKSVDVLIIANSNKPQFDNLMQQPANVPIVKPKVEPTLQNADNIKYMQQIIDLI